MRLVPTPLEGLFLVELEPLRDVRGLFARSFCAETFAAHGLDGRVAQCNVSCNAKRGTLRGLHWQAAPFEEAKLVRCVRGAIWDVAVDLRAGSATRGRWFGVELDAKERRALYLPPGFAHGFQTLTDDTELLYQMSVPYRPEAARGLRWSDPTVAVRWPLPDPLVSERDQALPTWGALFGELSDGSV
jgi:dTDP-4-dehydrorhamnose 3,5-epimerase